MSHCQGCSKTSLQLCTAMIVAKSRTEFHFLLLCADEKLHKAIFRVTFVATKLRDKMHEKSAPFKRGPL